MGKIGAVRGKSHAGLSRRYFWKGIAAGGCGCRVRPWPVQRIPPTPQEAPRCHRKHPPRGRPAPTRQHIHAIFRNGAPLQTWTDSDKMPVCPDASAYQDQHALMQLHIAANGGGSMPTRLNLNTTQCRCTSMPVAVNARAPTQLYGVRLVH